MNRLQSNWLALFSSNLFGVFNDNFLKNCIVFIAIGWNLPTWLSQSQLIAMVSAALILPYLFLSPLAGRLTLIYTKKKVFLFFKLMEFPIMVIAAMAFYYEMLFLAIFSVLLMGIQSSLYSPSKYGLIRDIGDESGVSFGSGIFETMAFLGILLGTVAASLISDSSSIWLVYPFFFGLALLGYIATKAIVVKESEDENLRSTHLNPITFLVESYTFARKHALLNTAIMGSSLFWLIGGVLQMNLIVHSTKVYHSSNTSTGLVMTAAAIGIAAGCMVAARISGKGVKHGLILIGLTGMLLLFLMLSSFILPLEIYISGVFLAAFLGGFFQVPCLAIIQQSNVGRKLGDMIAYLNLVTFIAVLFGTLIFSGISYFTNENSFAVFGFLSILCGLIALFFIKASPIFLKSTRSIIK